MFLRIFFTASTLFSHHQTATARFWGVLFTSSNTSIHGDPAGIQTLDLQNRNLTLYSAKLRGHLRHGGFVHRNALAKVVKGMNLTNCERTFFAL